MSELERVALAAALLISTVTLMLVIGIMQKLGWL